MSSQSEARTFSFPKSPSGLGADEEEAAAISNFVRDLAAIWIRRERRGEQDPDRLGWLTDCHERLWKGDFTPASAPAGSAQDHEPRPRAAATDPSPRQLPVLRKLVSPTPGSWLAEAPYLWPILLFLPVDEAKPLWAKNVEMAWPEPHIIGLWASRARIPEDLARRWSDGAGRVEALDPGTLKNALTIIMDTGLTLLLAASDVPDLTWYRPGTTARPGTPLTGRDEGAHLLEQQLNRLVDLLNRLGAGKNSSLAKDLVGLDEVVRSVVPGGFVVDESPSPHPEWWRVDSWFRRRLDQHRRLIAEALEAFSTSAPSPVDRGVWEMVTEKSAAFDLSESPHPTKIQNRDGAGERLLAVLRLGLVRADGTLERAPRILWGGPA